MTLKVIQFAPLPIGMLADACLPGSACLATFDRTTSSDQQYEHLRSGLSDAAVTAMDNVIAWNRRSPDLDFRVIAQVEQTTELALVARDGIETIDDLRSRLLLVDAPNNGFVIALRALLARSGISSGDFRLEPAGGVTERLESLLAGRGDATLLGPPFVARALEEGCRVLAKVNDVWPAFPGQGLVVARSRLAEIRPKLLAWLSHLVQARDWARAFPREAVKMLEKAGMPDELASIIVAAIPSSLVPSAESCELLLEHRRLFDPQAASLTCVDFVDSAIARGIETGSPGGSSHK